MVPIVLKQIPDPLRMPTNKLYCRARCGPRLTEEAAEKLKNRYVLMRNSSREVEKEFCFPNLLSLTSFIGGGGGGEAPGHPHHSQAAGGRGQDLGEPGQDGPAAFCHRCQCGRSAENFPG